MFFALVRCVAGADWPMFGGTPARNMVASETGIATEWAEGKNIKWTAALGDVTYGTPVISGGRVYIGTNNDEAGSKEKRAVLKCFSEKDGRLLWRAVHDKLPDAGEDDRGIGICSTPCVTGDRVYYVSNRAELVCRAVEDGRQLWSLDMRTTLGVAPNQASASSPLVAGEHVFVLTGHGKNYRTGEIKNAQAPSFIAVHRLTGKVAWQDNSPGANILTGQWGSPAHGIVDGRPQVAFPGGDGWLYSFAPATGKLLWKFNCKAHEKSGGPGESKSELNLTAAPVFVGDRVYVAVGEPEAPSGPGALRCLRATGSGDVTATAEIWRTAESFNDSLSTVAVHEGLVYAADTAGFLHCLDAATGKILWTHDHLANIWGSPLVVDGKVFLQTGEGDVQVFQTGREKKLVKKNASLPDFAHGTPVAANGVLYLTGQKKLYAIAARGE